MRSPVVFNARIKSDSESDALSSGGSLGARVAGRQEAYYLLTLFLTYHTL